MESCCRNLLFITPHYTNYVVVIATSQLFASCSPDTLEGSWTPFTLSWGNSYTSTWIFETPWYVSYAVVKAPSFGFALLTGDSTKGTCSINTVGWMNALTCWFITVMTSPTTSANAFMIMIIHHTCASIFTVVWPTDARILCTNVCVAFLNYFLRSFTGLRYGTPS